MELSPDERTRQETQEHIDNVGKLLKSLAQKPMFESITHELILRGENHDSSKLEEPEFSTFVEFTPKLKESTYGSEEYKGFLRSMGTALDHHYANNRHHPEFYENGVGDMDLVDKIEMTCDWKAASMRHANGDINKSIEINTKRFKLSPQEVALLKMIAGLL